MINDSFRYDIRKFSFETVDCFDVLKSRLDKFWLYQDVLYNYKLV